jgi:outer membrane protein assembly factor BamE (lipoprotein component of BamABCDE complex)
MGRWMGWAALVFALLAGCDARRIAELEEGVATEADVRERFGEPAAVYAESGGARTFEYPRQPEGQRNYMITIDPDGKMSALRQVLQPATFAKVTPGMDHAAVRRLLGRPAQVQAYPLRQQEVWDWRYLEGGQAQQFSVTFDSAGRVVTSGSTIDPRENQVGGR